MVEIEIYSKTKSKVRQPAASWLPQIPCLLGLAAPSMGGKGVLLSNLIMNPALYHTEKGEPWFDEVHYFSGSAKLDVNLEPIRRYCEDVLKMDQEKTHACIQA